MKNRFWMMNSEYEFVEVNAEEYETEQKDGVNLINNRLKATIYPDSILWDVELGNVHGIDISTINKIVADVEAEEGHA